MLTKETYVERHFLSLLAASNRHNMSLPYRENSQNSHTPEHQPVPKSLVFKVFQETVSQ
jgi:hypothetical protein